MPYNPEPGATVLDIDIAEPHPLELGNREFCTPKPGTPELGTIESDDCRVWYYTAWYS